MRRDEALELVHSRLGKGPTAAHCLACEACMRALAARFGEDPEPWGLAGLTHDIDLDECANDPARHALVGAEILRVKGAPDAVVDAVLGHNDKAPRASMMSKALWVVDPTTGFITAVALIRPSRSTSDLGVASIKKRMKDKRFAAAVRREQIAACEAELGLGLEEFLSVCLAAMDGVRDAIGLGGAAPPG
jgi:uncharacterized protein